MDNKDKIIQYRFTAYLMKSIRVYKAKYIKKKKLRQQLEELVDDFTDIALEIPQYLLSDSDLFPNEFENIAFEHALKKVKERDLRILILHLLEEYSLKEISALLHLNYNTVLSIYSRTIKKIRNEMEDGSNQF